MKSNGKFLGKLALGIFASVAFCFVTLCTNASAQSVSTGKMLQNKDIDVVEELRRLNWMRDALKLEEDMMDGQGAVPNTDFTFPSVDDFKSASSLEAAPISQKNKAALTSPAVANGNKKSSSTSLKPSTQSSSMKNKGK